MSLPTEDLVAIQQLYARYNTAIDTGDSKTFGGCFVDSGHLDSGFSQIEGRADLTAFAEKTHESMPGMRHNATNVLFDGEANAKSGQAEGSAFLIGYTTNGGYKVIVTGRYSDQLEKVDGRWFFAKRALSPDS